MKAGETRAGGLTPVSFKAPPGAMPRLSAPRVPGRRHERFWTEQENDVLRRYFTSRGAEACEAHLPGRPRGSIYQHANKLGLTRPRRGAGPRIARPADIDERIRHEWALLDGKKRGEVGALAERLGVPRWWLSTRAKRLRLTVPHRKEPDWTAAEIALMSKVPLHDLRRCAEIFRQHGYARTATAIAVKATRLALSRAFRDALSACAAAKVLGVDTKTVIREILMGDLAAEKRPTARLPQQGGDPWAITPAALRRYILDHADRVDLRKVEKFAFLQIVAGEELME